MVVINVHPKIFGHIFATLTDSVLSFSVSDFIDFSLIVTTIRTHSFEATFALVLSVKDAERLITCLTLFDRASGYWILIFREYFHMISILNKS